MKATGHFRVYFNKHADAPNVWCISPLCDAGRPLWELCVPGIAFNVPVVTMYKPKLTPDDEDGIPSAWLEVHGVLVEESCGFFAFNKDEGGE